MKSFQPENLTLPSLLMAFWRGKWIILITTAALALVAAGFAMVVSPKYQATIVFSPKSDSGSAPVSGGGSSIAGLASLVGVSIGSDGRKESVAVLQSEVLTEKYIQDNNLLPILFSDKWDPIKKKWNSSGSREETVPTNWLGNQLFVNSIRVIAEDRKTGLTKMTITWSDPKLATQWANGLVAEANEYLRSKAIAESERRIAYLKEQAVATDVAQVRTAMYQIMESEIKNIMLAKGSPEYALRVIDPAVIPEKRFSPVRREWVAVGFLSGFFISLILVYIREFEWKGRSRQS